ncbi:MAG: lysophospholipid acyltransferase family protein, partial [Steroidobacteraceae bacterium]
MPDTAHAAPAGQPAGMELAAPWRIVYGVYAWLQFTLIGAACLAVLLCLRPLERRRAVVRRLSAVVLRLAGMRLHLADLDALPRPCVVVANHCSYLDGVVLAAALPAQFGFVIKREMMAVPLAGLLLQRIGAE